MKSRIATALVVIGVLSFGSVGAFAAVGHVNAAGTAHHKAKAKKAKRHHHKARHHKTHKAVKAPSTSSAAVSAPAVGAPAAAERSAAAQEYGTRPGKGCGDKNHEHTGPPGNPSNTDCPKK